MEWSKLIEAAEESDWPSPEKQGFVKSGLMYLQEFFGDRVLGLAFQSYHPYFTETYNWAPWNLQRYAESGHRLKALSDVPNASHRFKQLRKAAATYPGRESIEMFFGLFNEVEITYPLVRQGIPTEFFRETSSPTPDVRARIDRRWLNIEITNLRDPASYWDAQKFKARLRDTIAGNFSAQPYLLRIDLGRLWRDIEDCQEETISEIVESIRHLLSSSATENQVNLAGIEVEVYRLTSGAGLCMVPPAGPQWVIDYPRKIRRSVADKARQLQSHGPCAIVICDSVFDSPDIPESLPKMKEFIEQLVMPISHVCSVMLVFEETNMWGVSPWPIEGTGLAFAQYVLCEGTRLLSKLLVPNLGAKEPLTQAELDALLAYPEVN